MAIIVGLLIVAIYPRTRAVIRLLGAIALVVYWIDAYARHLRNGFLSTARQVAAAKHLTQKAWREGYDASTRLTNVSRAGSPYLERKRRVRSLAMSLSLANNITTGTRVLDLGCSAAVLERVVRSGGDYVGLELSSPAGARDSDSGCVCGDAAALPFGDSTVDAFVMDGVLEQLPHPDHAVWEAARVLRTDGILLLVTKNASQAPSDSVIRNPLQWIERALGALHPWLISHRRWLADPLPHAAPVGEATPVVRLPDTQHIMAETRALLAAAGLETIRWSTLEFPPAKSRTAEALDGLGRLGAWIGAAVELVARHTPWLRRMGTHLLMVAKKTGTPVAVRPPSWVWRSPFPGDDHASAESAHYTERLGVKAPPGKHA